jgi:predicted PurR-regulated permease PerM
MLDLFERSKHNRHSDHYGQDHRRTGYGDERYGHYNPLLNMAQKLLRNKAILAGIVLTILLIGAVGIWLIVTLVPYIGQIISIVEKQGIKGILETITPLLQILQKIWEGSGK